MTVPQQVPQQTEKGLQTAVLQLAKLFHWRTYHPWLSIRSQRGWPDLALCKPPRLILAELKTDKGLVKQEQAEWLRDLSNCPETEVYLWRPSGWDAIVHVLQATEAPARGAWGRL